MSNISNYIVLGEIWNKFTEVTFEIVEILQVKCGKFKKFESKRGATEEFSLDGDSKIQAETAK